MATTREINYTGFSTDDDAELDENGTLKGKKRRTAVDFDDEGRPVGIRGFRTGEDGSEQYGGLRKFDPDEDPALTKYLQRERDQAGAKARAKDMPPPKDALSDTAKARTAAISSLFESSADETQKKKQAKEKEQYYGKD